MKTKIFPKLYSAHMQGMIKKILTSSIVEAGIVEGMSFNSRRRVRIINFVAVVGMIICVVFSVGESIAWLRGNDDLRYLVLANIVLFVLLMFVPMLNLLIGYVFAGVYHLIVTYLAILGFSLLAGKNQGMHFWCLIGSAAVFLVFEETLSWLRTMLVGVSMLLFFSIEYCCIDTAALYPLSPTASTLSRTLNFTMIFLTLVGIISIFHRQTARAELLLKREFERSEKLLLNILPASIAHRLKLGEDSIVDSFSDVSVMFVDIVGFTPLSNMLPSERVIWVLNSIFTCFDEIIDQHRLEKIKTIGDCYMVVGGLPDMRLHHLQAVASAAIEMQKELERLSKIIGISLEARIGIHTGAVVAGVLGKKKFTYDLWGDTVNTASRMETHGEAGKIHCTRAVYEQLCHIYAFEERGEIEIKGKGAMQTYFLIKDNSRYSLE